MWRFAEAAPPYGAYRLVMAAIDIRVIRTPVSERATTPPKRALLLVQIVVGYEWLVSGLSKVANGNFPHGLAAQLRDLAKMSPSWYGQFLRSSISPHAVTFGYLIEFAELAAGIVLVGVALAELAPGRWLSGRISRFFRLLVLAALVGGIVMAANFELANGSGFGLHLSRNSFDEGVDLDTIMVAVQLALLVSLRRWRRHPGLVRENGRNQTLRKPGHSCRTREPHVALARV